MLASSGRVAIYAAPRPEDPLWLFGSAMIGYDAATGEAVARRPPLGLKPECWSALTADPRRYGFHATLKAPFALANTTALEHLSQAIRVFCEGTVALPPFELGVRVIGEFLALVATGAPSELQSFAASVVTGFDRFRAPLSPAERGRRLAAALERAANPQSRPMGLPLCARGFSFSHVAHRQRFATRPCVTS